MNCMLGIRTNEYVILAANKESYMHGRMLQSSDHNKEFQLGEKLFMTCIGELADSEDFGNWAQANLRFYKTRNGYELDPLSAHHWLRKSIADNMRSEHFWEVNLLLGGYDKFKNQTFLSSIDYLGNGISDQNYLFSGMGGRYCYAILDSLYKEDMAEAEGVNVLNKCLVEIKKRSLVSQNSFSVLIISRDGTRHLDDIKF